MRGAHRREGMEKIVLQQSSLRFHLKISLFVWVFKYCKNSADSLEFFMSEAFLFGSTSKSTVRNKYQFLIGSRNVSASDIKISLM